MKASEWVGAHGWDGVVCLDMEEDEWLSIVVMTPNGTPVQINMIDFPAMAGKDGYTNIDVIPQPADPNSDEAPIIGVMGIYNYGRCTLANKELHPAVNEWPAVSTLVGMISHDKTAKFDA